MRYLVAICVCIYSLNTTAQEITGTWEEHSETRFTSYTKLCIVKICNQYIGYLFDRDNDNGYCKADFFGVYNKKRQLLHGETTAFMEHTPGHVLAAYTLYYKKERNDEILTGTVYEKPDSLYQMIEGIPRLIIINDPRPEYIRFKRTGSVADSTAYMQLMASKPCKNDPSPIVANHGIVSSPLVVTEPVKEKKLEKLPVDTPVVITPQAAIVQMQTRRVNDTLAVRSTVEKELFIHVLDDAITDGDTISIIHNGKLIAERIRVSAKAFPIKISLTKEDPYHELVLVAHNLGSIPPNTALLVIRYGEEEYRLHAIADLSKNALIIFKYTGQ